MDIIVRQVRGGFRARFDLKGEVFAKRGKTKDTAICNLILCHRRRLGIDKVRWDRTDNWTRNYLAGKSNKRRMPPKGLWLEKLPEAVSANDARKIRVMDLLSLPASLGPPLIFAFPPDARSALTLGDICDRTLQEIIQNQDKDFCFGPSRIAHLRKLLQHYGLSLKGE